jgi:hypothetical protein
VPPLQLNKLLGALRFQSKNIELPADYARIPQKERDDYVNSLAPQHRVAIPRLIPQWYKPALPIAPHQLMCDHAGQAFKDVHDLLCDAIVYGHNLWRLQAQFTPMPIAGPSVAGPPGCLTGPPLDQLAAAYPGMTTLMPLQRKYTDSILAGVGQAYTMWQSSVTVPGLPFFPAYAVQPPGPAIPTPNVPQKLIACVSANIGAILIPDGMKELMVAAFRKHGLRDDPSTDALFEAIATVLSLGFANWLTNQMVVGIVGSGAVASVVGGPVAGVTLPTPGHLAT